MDILEIVVLGSVLICVVVFVMASVRLERSNHRPEFDDIYDKDNIHRRATSRREL